MEQDQLSFLGAGGDEVLPEGLADSAVEAVDSVVEDPQEVRNHEQGATAQSQEFVAFQREKLFVYVCF